MKKLLVLLLTATLMSSTLTVQAAAPKKSDAEIALVPKTQDEKFHVEDGCMIVAKEKSYEDCKEEALKKLHDAFPFVADLDIVSHMAFFSYEEGTWIGVMQEDFVDELSLENEKIWTWLHVNQKAIIPGGYTITGDLLIMEFVDKTFTFSEDYSYMQTTEVLEKGYGSMKNRDALIQVLERYFHEEWKVPAAERQV